ncbi:hypothetical protein BU24DRAFT_425419 [Aaosphaeria arxii CBS 175.79]|uniref:Uncharacterized protein n=1 Tax=Aaosphaeria arxii CBS 175.79 TaxID=1450172 RepID=A0A6A5XIY7_9PLEO|nr:uncharacterized protein BU24DRAFT_425419 [Aaosphaeria arxii CBS 175.79]KAF2012797.1 hypothetical protein BU24DRAFT_425419 [Aaosphaeria arxii CBS 175.79]
MKEEKDIHVTVIQLDIPRKPLPVYSPEIRVDGTGNGPRESLPQRALRYVTVDAIKARYETLKPKVESLSKRTISSVQAIDVSSGFQKGWTKFKAFPWNKQIRALILVLVFGVAPLVILGRFTYSWTGPFTTIFTPKTLTCGNISGTPQNSTVSGIQGFFVLDVTFGKLPFYQVKIIDVLWDLVLGRGVQLLAWWASYRIFADVLLGIIERHATSYETFLHIALDGPSLASMWTLIKDLFRTRSKRTWALFFYMLVSILYVLCIPVFLGAMTGYDSTQIPWVDLDDNNHIIPASTVDNGLIVHSLGNKTFSNPICSSELDSKINTYNNEQYERQQNCDCRLPNGTVLAWTKWADRYYYNWGSDYRLGDCVTVFPNTKTYKDWDGNTKSCNGSTYYTLSDDGKTYDVATANYESGFCYDGIGYSYSTLWSKSRCLPDTAHQTYEWGFSTMMSATFIFLQFLWTITMYIIWQDAQIKSKLVRSGYAMTQLRAAFTLAAAARWRTGLNNRALVRRDTKQLERELFGSKKAQKEQTVVSYELFQEGRNSMRDSLEADFKKRKGSEYCDI